MEGWPPVVAFNFFHMYLLSSVCEIALRRGLLRSSMTSYVVALQCTLPSSINERFTQKVGRLIYPIRVTFTFNLYSNVNTYSLCPKILHPDFEMLEIYGLQLIGLNWKFAGWCKASTQNCGILVSPNCMSKRSYLRYRCVVWLLPLISYGEQLHRWVKDFPHCWDPNKFWVL
jgi:hypothetical protein